MDSEWKELGEEVRKPEDNRLCLAWERGVNLWAEEAFRRMNTDESKVRSYTLPPIPDSREEWEAQKGELLQTFKDCMYGEMPPPPDKVELELLSEKKFPTPLKKPIVKKKTGLECVPSLFFAGV